MEQQLQTKKIIISELTSEKVEFGIKTTIHDQNNIKYSFFDKKKDGNNTLAQNQFDGMGLKLMDLVEVVFKEEQKSFQGRDGRMVEYTQRTIVEFRETDSKETEPLQEEVKHNTPKEDNFGRRLTVYGFVNAILSTGIRPENVDIEELIALADRIDERLA